jgi:hypothetical protein
LYLRLKKCTVEFEAQKMYCWIWGSKHVLLCSRLKKCAWIRGSGNLLLYLRLKKWTVGFERSCEPNKKRDDKIISNTHTMTSARMWLLTSPGFNSGKEKMHCVYVFIKW